MALALAACTVTIGSTINSEGSTSNEAKGVEERALRKEAQALFKPHNSAES
jgi:hypothetical protein